MGEEGLRPVPQPFAWRKVTLCLNAAVSCLSVPCAQWSCFPECCGPPPHPEDGGPPSQVHQNPNVVPEDQTIRRRRSQPTRPIPRPPSPSAPGAGTGGRPPDNA